MNPASKPGAMPVSFATNSVAHVDSKSKADPNDDP